MRGSDAARSPAPLTRHACHVLSLVFRTSEGSDRLRAGAPRPHGAVATGHGDPPPAPPGLLLEIGPGQGTLADLARASGWQYRGIDASAVLAETPAGARPRYRRSLGAADPSRGRQLRRPLCGPGPRAHGRDRRGAGAGVRGPSGRAAGRLVLRGRARLPEGAQLLLGRGLYAQLHHDRAARAAALYDGGFDIVEVVRQIGATSGVSCDLLAAGALLVNIPGTDTLSRWTRTESLLFKTRKNLFQTLAFVARRPTA
jgi:hypothetical protein